MICRNCKFTLSGNEKYCPNCGAPLHEEKEAVSPQAQPPKAPDIFFTPVKDEETDAPEIFRSQSSTEVQPPAPAEKQKKGAKSSSKAPVILMLMLIIAVLTVAIFVAAEKFNIAPAILSYLGSGEKTETDASVYSPEESLIPSPESGTITPDINYSPTEAYVARINLLSLRKGPSDAYGLIMSLESGTQLQITGGTAITDSWIYVYIPAEDCYGWVNASFISLYTYTEAARQPEARDYTHASEKSVF